MTKAEAMKKLKAMGSAQTRKIYARHGVAGTMFGVSYANLGRLQKQIKTDQALAEQLWASGNHDARVLATMIGNPAEIGAKTIDAWAKDLGDYVLTDAFSGIVTRSPFARKRVEKWTKSRNEWICAAGWNVLTGLANREDALADTECEGYLETIEEKIHSSKNRVRYAMNNALISIGIRSAKLEKKATAAAKRIGVVEVDHGETGCKTPNAVTYIPKAAAHRKKQLAKKTTRANPARRPRA